MSNEFESIKRGLFQAIGQAVVDAKKRKGVIPIGFDEVVTQEVLDRAVERGKSRSKGKEQGRGVDSERYTSVPESDKAQPTSLAKPNKETRLAMVEADSIAWAHQKRLS
jgi:hypothetical protein